MNQTETPAPMQAGAHDDGLVGGASDSQPKIQRLPADDTEGGEA